MDSPNPESLPLTIAPAQHQPRVLGFWWTSLWGFVLFAAMFIGQIAVVVFFVLARGNGLELGQAINEVAGSGLAISLSVISGLPTTLLALWFAVRMTRTPFADYLALHRPSWKDFLIGAGGLVVLVVGWDLMSRTLGRESAPDFMSDVLNSARSDGSVWLLVLALCLAAPLSEELMARGFLYRGWSETVLGAPGAIVLSSMVWTALHLQYDWYFFGEVFCLGLWFGYLRHRSGSLWLTIMLHGLNNLGALVESLVIAARSHP